MLADAGRPREGAIASLLGLGALLFAAIGVVVQLKDALNTVWEAENTSVCGTWRFIRSYVVSLARLWRPDTAEPMCGSRVLSSNG
jgi:membrane protein